MTFFAGPTDDSAFLSKKILVIFVHFVPLPSPGSSNHENQQEIGLLSPPQKTMMMTTKAKPTMTTTTTMEKPQEFLQNDANTSDPKRAKMDRKHSELDPKPALERFEKDQGRLRTGVG